MKYLLIFLGILTFSIFLYYYKLPENKEAYFDYDWSHKWSIYDREARKNADCKPINKIHMKLGPVSTWVWIVPKSCEQGLPHTRGVDVVAIPENFPKDKLPPVLDHEHIHLLQRMMPESWAKFYRLKWDYTIYNDAPFGMPSELTRLRRANPDTADTPYVCWRSRYWSVAVYPAIDKLKLKDAVVKWWDEKTGLIRDTAPDEWFSFFGDHINQSEHPHELSAEFLSGPLRMGARPSEMSPGLKALGDAWKLNAFYPEC